MQTTPLQSAWRQNAFVHCWSNGRVKQFSLGRLSITANPDRLIGQSKRPENRLKRRAPMRVYIASNMLPKAYLGPFEWFEVSILDRDYLGWLWPISDPPLVLFCVGERDAGSRRPVVLVGRSTTGQPVFIGPSTGSICSKRGGRVYSCTLKRGGEKYELGSGFDGFRI